MEEIKIYAQAMQLSGQYDSIANKYDYIDEYHGPTHHDIRRSFSNIKRFLEKENSKTLSPTEISLLSLESKLAGLKSSAASISLWKNSLVFNNIHETLFNGLSNRIYCIGTEESHMHELLEMIHKKTDYHFWKLWKFSDITEVYVDKESLGIFANGSQ